MTAIEGGDVMEVCILKFDGSRAAEDALAEVLEVEGERNPWLLEVGVIARPLVGRVRFGLTFPDGTSKTLHEGDLAEASADLGALSGYYLSAIAGPFGGMFATVNAALAAEAEGEEAEERLLHLTELRKALGRDSSALVLLGDSRRCDALVDLFKDYDAEVIRRDATKELLVKLQALHRRLAAEMVAQGEAAQGAPATH
jgi:hypothetical protein